MTDNSDAGKELLRKAKKAFSLPERYNAQVAWALLAEFVLPNQNREWFGDVTKGIRRDRNVFDSSPIQFNRDLASAIHSTVTNPAMHWSKLRFRQDDINDNRDAVNWLDQASSTFHNHLNDSNFDSMIGQCYQSYSALGTMILFQDEDFNFDAWHLAEVSFVENDKGYIDTAYRKFKLTLKQAYEKFGDEIGEDMVSKMETDPLQEIKFYHCIYPREVSKVKYNAIGLANPKERPFECKYIMEKGSKVVLEEGYYEFPVYVSRWSKLPGETYGFGPGHIALADIRTVNKMKEKYLAALAKAIDPPYVTTKQNMINGDFRAGKITTVRDMNGFKEVLTGSRFDVANISIEAIQESIKSCFYIDKLLLPPRTETGEMTAYEVAQRLEQMQQILGPVLSRLNTELLSPLVIRSLKILLRKKLLQPLPKSVAVKLPKNTNLAFDISFVNSLARSQQMSELRNVQQWLQEIMMFAQSKPEVLDNLNADTILAYSARIHNIPENLTLDPDAVKALRDQRQKQQEMQMGLSAGEQGSKIAKNLGQAQQAQQSGQTPGGNQ
jgi:hypothetical protein